MRSRFSFALMLALEFDIYLIDEGMPSSTDVEFNRKAGQVLRQRLKKCHRGGGISPAFDAGKVLPFRRRVAQWSVVYV